MASSDKAAKQNISVPEAIPQAHHPSTKRAWTNEQPKVTDTIRLMLDLKPMQLEVVWLSGTWKFRTPGKQAAAGTLVAHPLPYRGCYYICTDMKYGSFSRVPL